MGANAVLSSIVEGVQFEVLTPQGAFKAVVLADILMQCFGAGPSPQSWLSTYVAHAPALRRAAIEERQARPGADWVVLRLRRPQAALSDAAMLR